ncbi:hypothetical protein [Nocardia bovistercoris]|uniref:Uncharacterized protein n=1 Tax=Nocardia bovistercoris TaxID=2785916 RepID=A0A931I9N0_9NOCA|nr:hypothetical protein [Nocardia bovistercoris]MBH0777279.1 hypothetical protein [Nocardia bovistercoris]
MTSHDDIGLRGVDAMDDTIRAYYAQRVPDPAEAEWRADYGRVQDRLVQAGFPDHEHDPRAVAIVADAERIEARWTGDPKVAPRWEQLAEWHRMAEEAAHARNGADIPDLYTKIPQGGDPVTWRNVFQAVDLAGTARWPALDPERTSTGSSAGQGGNALAAALDRVERDGVER